MSLFDSEKRLIISKTKQTLQQRLRLEELSEERGVINAGTTRVDDSFHFSPLHNESYEKHKGVLVIKTIQTLQERLRLEKLSKERGVINAGTTRIDDSFHFSPLRNESYEKHKGVLVIRTLQTLQERLRLEELSKERGVINAGTTRVDDSSLYSRSKIFIH